MPPHVAFAEGNIAVVVARKLLWINTSGRGVEEAFNRPSCKRGLEEFGRHFVVLFVENEVVLFMDGPHPARVGGEMKDCMDSLHCSTADNGIP